jgi:hypothetical protein
MPTTETVAAMIRKDVKVYLNLYLHDSRIVIGEEVNGERAVEVMMFDGPRHLVWSLGEVPVHVGLGDARRVRDLA